MKQKKYYAVKEGRIPGVYNTWDECKAQTDGYSCAVYKSFPTEEEAKAFVLGTLNKTEDDGEVSEAYAYVDGSYLKGKSMFSFGAVLFHDGEEMHFSKAFDDPELALMHNVAGEIKGSEFVMQYCLDNDISSVDIYYDYEGIEKWCTGEWRANKPGTQKYAAFYKAVSADVCVRFVKVKGHSGVKYNELADKLAKSALGIK